MQDKYLTYSSISLAGEDTFIRWVLHGEDEHQWRQWMQQRAEMDNTIEEARRIVLSFSDSVVVDLPESGKQELWNRIHSSIQSNTQSRPKNYLRIIGTWSLAAAAALALFVWINNLTASEKILATAGEQKEILLPEQSAVTLNAGSKLSYKEKTFDQDRVLYLEGEAFFKVKPGSTFTVKTDDGTVTVLGTSFNVMSRNGRFEVSCYTGKVKVESGGKDQLILTTGEQSIKAKVDESMSRDRFIPLDVTPEWTLGRFNFENQPLSDVIAELERQYAVEVSLDVGLEEIKYTGLFESGDLEKALYLITWPLHLKASVKGKTVTISR